MKCLGIAGTPGTGKSAVAKELSSRLQIPLIDLSSYVIENKLYLYYDELRESYVIDEERVSESISSVYRELGSIVIAGHYIEILPKEIFELIIVLRRDPYELISILKLRGWPSHKIAENVEAELLSVCTLNIIEELGEDIVVEVDVTSKPLHLVVDEILSIVYGDKPMYYGHTIDWLSLMQEDKLSMVLEYISKNRGYT